MKTIINNYLYDITLGDIQEFANLAVQPLFSTLPTPTNYTSLNEGLRTGQITISELPTGPSVSHVHLVNRGDSPVIMLHGEEVAGAWQNRVFNTTIMVAGNSETVVPVSCTESGRWSSASDKFYNSDVVMTPDHRGKMAARVSFSLDDRKTYDSNQGEVWDEINTFARRANVYSNTAAMKDVYTEKERDVSEYETAFENVPGQKGMVLFVNGKLRVLEIVSSERVYRDYHSKLLQSYIIEAITIDNGGAREEVKKPLAYEAETFMRDAASWSQKEYSSVGIGDDYRFEDPNKTGSALLNGDELIHMALFDQSE